MAVRGGKKKKGGPVTSEGPLTNDIVNIWKDRPDPIIRPTEEYPVYVAELLRYHWCTEDYVFKMYRGELLPGPKETWSLAKNLQRQSLTMTNKAYKRDVEYESDEDEGEDLGQNIVVEMDDDYDSDDEDGPKKPMTEEERLMAEADL